MTDLAIRVGDVELTASWTDSTPRTRAAIESALPLRGAAARWGDELYFEVPVDVPAEETSVEVPVGAVAYWPRGNALCLFWGPTPASARDEPRAAGPVTVVAVIDDVESLSAIEGGATVEVADAE